ncbi:ankyrin repeat-containing domain protein [Thamnocephalis sphaerospora]|uniref:Ankyrin repeat-containing domain protein n=1 Tax=Thamnocephalis sphaerospora TaxID=78915 RepID=A0A4P9XN32_9FUNG|nr:ankyrin repeat-containing domain protein [Thamnocephalis sphaerospora]|eukprot:RKP07357.1 ankyrin repeat-containing domain protein [Thamnocephalis sphaerospora]
MKNIWIAASDGDIEGVKALLDAGQPVNAADDNGYTPLHAAASYDHLELIQLLLERGADANQADEDGDTPLFACETVRCAEALLAGGADATLRNEEGKSAAESAAEDPDRQQVAELLRTRFPETYSADNVALPTNEDLAFQERFEAMMQAMAAGEANGVSAAATADSQESDA